MSKLRSIVAAFMAAMIYAAPGVAADDAVHSGIVTFAQTAGNYTFVRIKDAGKEHWLAANSLTVAVGDVVEYAGGDVMTDFKSKAMNRTFDSIRFVARIHVVGKELPQDDIHKGIKTQAAPAGALPPGKIADATVAMTIGEILDPQAKLPGQTISLRAKVIKVSRNILGRNWVTLTDGTGKPPNDSIVATTQE
ncbi:MAG: hypothetical protein WAW79_11590, partial [Steroidobacteraceae bacterium]